MQNLCTDWAHHLLPEARVSLRIVRTNPPEPWLSLMASVGTDGVELTLLSLKHKRENPPKVSSKQNWLVNKGSSRVVRKPEELKIFMQTAQDICSEESWNHRLSWVERSPFLLEETIKYNTKFLPGKHQEAAQKDYRIVHILRRMQTQTQQ